MTSSTPRKFAEKIAKLQQSEQAQNQAFEQIMAEVIVATRQGGGTPAASESDPQSGLLLRINQNSSNRAESLPNVNHMTGPPSRASGIDLRSALNSLEGLKQGKNPSNRDRQRHVSPNSSGNMASPRNHHSTNIRSTHSSSQHTSRSSDHHRRASPASPYSTPYLSPPDVWRRTNSDSALHQSALMAERNESSYCNTSSTNQGRRSPAFIASSSLTNISDVSDHSHLTEHHSSVAWIEDKSSLQPQRNTATQYTLENNNILHENNNILHEMNGTNGCIEGANNSLRPKSCDVPGITICPSQEEANSSHHNHHAPISQNTGSLPDLTSFHFPAPLNTPIDIEESMLAGSNTTVTASNSHSASSNPSYALQNSPGSPYGHRTLQSPYSVNSNPNSPYSPQSPLSALGYSPPPPSTLDGSSIIQHPQQLNYDPSKQEIQQQTVGFGHSPHVLSQARPPIITVEGLALDTSQLSLDSRPSHASPVTSIASSTSHLHDYTCGTVINDPMNAHDSITRVSTGNGQTSVLSLNLTENNLHSQSQQAQQQQSQQLSSACTSTSPTSPHSSDEFFNTNFQPNTPQSQFEQFRIVNNVDSVPMYNLTDDTGQAMNMCYSTNQKQVLDDSTFLNFVVDSSNTSLDNSGATYIKSNGSQNSPPECRLNDEGSIEPLCNISNAPAAIFPKSVISCATSSIASQTNYHMPQHQRHTISSSNTSGIPDIVLTEAAPDSETLSRHEYSKDLSGSSFDGDLFSSESFEGPPLSDSFGDQIDFEGFQFLADSTNEVN